MTTTRQFFSFIFANEEGKTRTFSVSNINPALSLSDIAASVAQLLNSEVLNIGDTVVSRLLKGFRVTETNEKLI
jgi:hypothetical protein